MQANRPAPGGSTPRQRRLQADLGKVQQLCAGSGGTLRLVSTQGAPPFKYVIEYHCPSLVRKPGGKPEVRAVHQVEISLPGNYPSSSPTARMLTPVFNPHVFVTQSICLGIRWTPIETLDALILRIGAILQMDPKVLDFHSLANGEAGNWAHKHLAELPLAGWVSFKAPKVS